VTLPTRVRAHAPAVGLAVLLLLGASLRLVDLAGPAFNIDEVMHAYVGARLADGDPPELPSGVRYTRALPYSQAVALAARGRVDEWTARVPSVIFGTLTIGLVFLLTRRWYSNAAALTAALITATAPMQVAFSREARMYAAFQFFFLAFAFAAFQGFETAPGVRERRWMPAPVARWCGGIGIRPAALLVAAALLAVSRELHELTLIAVAGPAAYVALMAAAAVTAAAVGAPLRLRTAKYVGATVALLAAGLAYALSHRLWDRFVSVASYTPAWAADNASWRFYLGVLSDYFPVMLETLPLSAAVAATINPKATLYLLACLGVPLACQSLLFDWKHDRYIFHLLPFMFIPFSVGVCGAVSAIRRSLAASLATATAHHVARRVAAGLAAIVTVSALTLVPWIREGFAVHQQTEGSFAGVYHQDWRAASAFVAARAGADDVVIASAPGLARYYGLHQPLYYLANDSTDAHLEEAVVDKDGHRLDYIAGARLILDAQQLERVMARHSAGWIISERFRFEGKRPLPDDVRRVIGVRARTEDLPAASSMIVWRWPR
jgi:4-amino-4-deoxy-L-arabinose transferase-like glycosyltransferase